MKALSFSQPWLWAILHADKRIENRQWKPSPKMIGVPFALHAAKSFDDDGLPFMWKLGIETPTEYVKSAIVGTATIDRVYDKLLDGDPSAGEIAPNMMMPDEQNRWFFGRYGFLLRGVRELATPIPCKGALSFWQVPADIEAQIAAQLGGA